MRKEASKMEVNGKSIKEQVWVYVVSILILAIISNNTTVNKVETYIISDKIQGDNYKIVQISDFHSMDYNLSGHQLYDTIQDINPDSVVITGDLLNCSPKRGNFKDDIKAICKQFRKIAKGYLTYYINGNHEASVSKEVYTELIDGLSNIGIKDLDNKTEIVRKGRTKLRLVGISDPAMDNRDIRNEKGYIEGIINGNSKDMENNIYTILLAHRPERADEYSQVLVKDTSGIDLVLSGHTHGGLVQLPMINGLIAPDQGLFPKYSDGLYEVNGIKLIVSSGLGSSIERIRWLNKPELNIIIIKSDKYNSISDNIKEGVKSIINDINRYNEGKKASSNRDK